MKGPLRTAVVICSSIFFSLLGQNQGDVQLPLHEQKILRVAEQIDIFQNADNIIINEVEGGLTNQNYKVSIGPSSYFFRSSTGNNDFLGCSLEREWIITNKVSEVGLAPKVIFYSEMDRILVTDFIETVGTKVDLHDPLTMQKVGRSVSLLHHLTISFPTEFCPFETIKKYIETASTNGIDLPNNLIHIVLPYINSLQKIIPLTIAYSKTPTHLDLHAGNILDDGQNLWLIDWEYAAMGDPFFDLATMASIEVLSNNEMNELLQYYLEDKNPSPEMTLYFYEMRIVADTRWALWCYLQAKLSPISASFNERGDVYLQQCLERIIKLDIGSEDLISKKSK
ncbi:MAG: choline/ethanolamine kinase family protein [Parachlamydiaceae bacterium]